ncbi:hypothetical protein OH76DRAFT_1412698 [Lentinus brumalis]|uniref:Uncharacterized protein n=1 Tax=Lentinus brumalis TaxID=2498619 RepID=A0A371CKJ8_9APHY|nr:hypothetical protein OH76DRAFT_1412698 [Polyporus brumalis]
MFDDLASLVRGPSKVGRNRETALIDSSAVKSAPFSTADSQERPSHCPDVSPFPPPPCPGISYPHTPDPVARRSAYHRAPPSRAKKEDRKKESKKPGASRAYPYEHWLIKGEGYESSVVRRSTGTLAESRKRSSVSETTWHLHCER